MAKIRAIKEMAKKTQVMSIPLGLVAMIVFGLFPFDFVVLTNIFYRYYMKYRELYPFNGQFDTLNIKITSRSTHELLRMRG